MTDVSIIGWGHTRFGRHEGVGVELLIAEAVKKALEHAVVEARDVDAIFVGQMNGGFDPQNFVSSLVLQVDRGFRFKPATHLENACASGSAALYAGIDTIAARRARRALVVGVEKMTALATPAVARVLAGASYWPEEGGEGLTFPGIFARFAQAYFSAHGDNSEALAQIAVKNHANGARNPYAHFRKALDLAFCRTESDKNPIVAPPLKVTDCSAVSDGAAAIVLADEHCARYAPRAVRIVARAQVNDLLPMSGRALPAFEGPARAWNEALSAAGCRLEDLDFAEVHDCFTIAELLSYEAMGLTPKGQGARAIMEGWTCADGRFPVNASGGLKAKGHPIGATGVSMHVMAAMQLCGEAGEFQLRRADRAGVFNMGGSAVANYVSILDRGHA
jgi:acetyl-CoA C-acetyltransferase